MSEPELSDAELVLSFEVLPDGPLESVASPVLLLLFCGALVWVVLLAALEPEPPLPPLDEDAVLDVPLAPPVGPVDVPPELVVPMGPTVGALLVLEAPVVLGTVVD